MLKAQQFKTIFRVEEVKLTEMGANKMTELAKYLESVYNARYLWTHFDLRKGVTYHLYGWDGGTILRKRVSGESETVMVNPKQETLDQVDKLVRLREITCNTEMTFKDLPAALKSALVRQNDEFERLVMRLFNGHTGRMNHDGVRKQAAATILAEGIIPKSEVVQVVTPENRRKREDGEEIVAFYAFCEEETERPIMLAHKAVLLEDKDKSNEAEAPKIKDEFQISECPRKIMAVIEAGL